LQGVNAVQDTGHTQLSPPPLLQSSQPTQITHSLAADSPRLDMGDREDQPPHVLTYRCAKFHHVRHRSCLKQWIVFRKLFHFQDKRPTFPTGSPSFLAAFNDLAVVAFLFSHPPNTFLDSLPPLYIYICIYIFYIYKYIYISVALTSRLTGCFTTSRTRGYL
jgi:hypothetical protein